MKFRIFRRVGFFGPRWYWRLVAGNGRIVCSSEGYRNRVDAEATIAVIRKNAAYARVEPGE